EYTYELLDEAQWDDDSPITANDVVFTMKANKCPLVLNSTLRAYVQNIKTIRLDSLNPKKFTVMMKKKYVENINCLTSMPILSEKYFDPKNIMGHYTFEQFDDPSFKADEEKDLSAWSVEFNSGKYGTDLNFTYGSGPYKIVSWDKDQ